MLATGRSQLQKYQLAKICEAGGYGRLIYPENEEEIIAELQQFIIMYGRF
jgi:hypothetical protein